jgi:hypothetical protein
MRYLIPLLLIASACNRLTPEDYDAVIDQDSDGFASLTYGGQDCDDEDPNIHPDATELCDGSDNDCDGETDEANADDVVTWYADSDGDGYGDPDNDRQACDQPSGYLADNTDCDDDDDAIHPLTWWYADADSDSYGDLDSSVQQCAQPDDHVLDSTDCDDTRDDVNPAEDEQCDEVDHDCDDDDGMLDDDGDGFAVCEGDCNDDDQNVFPGAEETCNEIDDDCDEVIDENDATDAVTWYADTDSDTYGDPDVTTVECYQPSGYVTDDTDCDDGAASVYPGADETCNEVDDDCDGTVDEDDALDAGTWYADTDGDGYGDATSSTIACTASTGWIADATDCDDEDPDQFPGADEYCNGDDDDCDGTVDEDDAQDVSTWYIDADNDDYGINTTVIVACDQPSGFVLDDTDCDDTDGAVNPGADELCNEIDDNCDERIDPDDSVDANTWYGDSDGDGYGDDATAFTQCREPSNGVLIGGDCDDGNATVNPDAVEICDEVDNDCDASNDYDFIVDSYGKASIYTTIQDGVNSASAGESVCVLAGTYTETVSISTEIVLEGESSASTTIDAAGASPVLHLYNVGGSVEVRGFTLTGGEGSQGVAITSTTSDPLLEDLVIQGNHASSSGQCLGAFIYLYYSFTYMDRVTITGNGADCDNIYGTVTAYASDAILDHIEYSANHLTGDTDVYGGLGVVSGSSMLLTNAIITGNTVAPAGDSVSVRSTSLFNIGGSPLDIVNTTIHGNNADGGDGHVYAGVLWDGDGGTTVLNTAISNNLCSGDGIDATVGYGGTTITYSDIWQQDTPRFHNMADPTGIGSVYEQDPQYTSAAAGDPSTWDLTLQSSSYLIDRGDPTINDADGSRSDVGAYGGPGSDGW